MSELEMTHSQMEEYDPCNMWFDMPKCGGFEWQAQKCQKEGQTKWWGGIYYVQLCT